MSKDKSKPEHVVLRGHAVTFQGWLEAHSSVAELEARFVERIKPGDFKRVAPRKP
jgi:hypothetical protein